MRQKCNLSDGNKLLKKIKSIDYETNRNYLDKDTSRLSPYIKFGVISIREIYKYAKKT
jgi:deoxyribodipyrimidine photolyase